MNSGKDSDVLPDITTIDSNSVITLREIFFDDIDPLDVEEPNLPIDSSSKPEKESKSKKKSKKKSKNQKRSSSKTTESQKRRPWRN